MSEKRSLEVALKLIVALLTKTQDSAQIEILQALSMIINDLYNLKVGKSND